MTVSYENENAIIEFDQAQTGIEEIEMPFKKQAIQ